MYSGIYTDNLATHPLLPLFFADFEVPDGLIDARHLACPMPLLKTKLALKSPDIHKLYVLTTDPHSLQDMDRFCQKQNLHLQHWHSQKNADTIFHFIITKNASN